MAKPNFVNLRVYNLSEELADAIWDVVMTWDSLPRRTVGEQLICAADSIGANIAEGTGRKSFQDNRRFVRYARGSLNETHHWLRRAYRRKLLQQSDVDKLIELLDQLGPKLGAYLKSIGAGHDDKPPRATRRNQATDHGPRTTDHGQ